MKQTQKTRKGENIRLRKDGRYEGRYSKGIIDGKRKQGSVFGKTYEEAREKLIIAKAEFKKKKEAQEAKEKLISEEGSFQAIAEEWFDSIRPTLKPSSAASYRNILTKWLLPVFGGREITDITRNEVNEVLMGYLYPTNPPHNRQYNQLQNAQSNQTNKPQNAQPNQTNQTHYSNNNQTNQAHYSNNNQTNQTHYSSNNQTNQAHNPQSNQAHYSSNNQTNQAHYSSNNQTNQVHNPQSNQAHYLHNDSAKNVDFYMSKGGCGDGGLSPKTVGCILSVMKLIFNYAETVKGFQMPSLNSIKIKRVNKPLRVLSHREQHQVVTQIYKSLNLINFGILLSLYTGIRVGELCALTWGDISKREHTLTVARTMQRVQILRGEERKKSRTKVIIIPPNSATQIRTIPIPKEIWPVVEELRTPDDCYILSGMKEKYVEPRTMENRFKNLMKKCKIEGATMHTCRHTFATRCIELGFDPKTLSEILGHSSVNITLDRYVHPSMMQKASRMNMVKIGI